MTFLSGQGGVRLVFESGNTIAVFVKELLSITDIGILEFNSVSGMATLVVQAVGGGEKVRKEIYKWLKEKEEKCQ